MLLNKFLIFLVCEKLSLEDHFKYMVLIRKGVIITLLSSLFREGAILFLQIFFCFIGACLYNNSLNTKEKKPNGFDKTHL